MGFLPEHFAKQIDKHGKFIDYGEPKLAWQKNEYGKYDFVFKDSFNEMLTDFAQHQPHLVADGKKVPYDWTIYYLRKKALTQRLTKEELAWILLQFNQKRGYYQLRGEDEDEQQDKLIEFIAQKVVRVEATDEKKGDDVWYNVYLENGMVYRRTSKTPLDWEGKVKEFIVTTDLEKDGTPKKDKEGNIKRSFRAPKEDDWTLLKKKTEFDIDNSHMTVGCYIYDNLLQKPNQKIIGKLVRTVERVATAPFTVTRPAFMRPCTRAREKPSFWLVSHTSNLSIPSGGITNSRLSPSIEITRTPTFRSVSRRWPEEGSWPRGLRLRLECRGGW